MFFKDPPRLGELSLSARIAVTAFLVLSGIGYLFGFLNIYVTYNAVDQQPGLSPADIALTFYGKRDATKLEKSIDGSMRTYLAADADYQSIKAWLADGATEAGFERVKPIFDTSCSTCHSQAAQVANVVTETYADVSQYLAQDTGKSVGRLIALSHTHILATLPVLFILAMVFSLTAFPEWLKAAVIGFSFFAVALDIGSWWLAKLSPAVAPLVILGGASLGLSFGALVVLPLYEMWLKRAPA